MNPFEYLVTGLLVVLSAATWTLLSAIKLAPDGFETERGFQLGITPASVVQFPAYAPATPARAVVPEGTSIVAPRRPPGSKPPMLPVDLTVADLNPSTERKPRQTPDSSETIPPFSPGNQAPASGSTETPTT